MDGDERSRCTETRQLLAAPSTVANDPLPYVSTSILESG